MKVLIAPNALKGTLTAMEAGQIIQSFIQHKFPEFETQLVPIADGGDGTCFLLGEYMGLSQKRIWSLDSVGRSKTGVFYWNEMDDTCFMDISTVSGLGDLEEHLQSPKHTSTYGTGLLVKEAIGLGAKEIVLGLGGSATIDLGLGILQGLGFSFLNQNGRIIHPYSDSLMKDLQHIQLPVPFPKIKFRLLCDVRNSFFGSQGAIPVFGPQKGLKKNVFKEYEILSQHVAERLYQKGKRVFVDQEGFGAAGGIALGLSAFFPVAIEFGAPYFFDKVKIINSIQEADFILTAEGRFDEQSKEGKACYELLQLSKQYGKSTVLISSGEEGRKAGFNQFIQLPDIDFKKEGVKDQASTGLKHSLEKLLLK